MAEEFDAVAITVDTNDDDASPTVFVGSMDFLEMKTKQKPVEESSFLSRRLIYLISMLVSQLFVSHKLLFTCLSQTQDCRGEQITKGCNLLDFGQ